MKNFLRILLIISFVTGFANSGLSQGLTITGTVEANDLTISGTVNAGALTTVKDLAVLGNLYVAQSFLPTNIIAAGSITAGGSIRATGTVAGGALSINNNAIIGGALSVVGALSAGNFQASTVTGNTGFLQMRQTGDTYGESGLYVYNRNGSNGPIFYTGNNVDLVDMGYLSLTSNSQFNMRFEHRSASVLNTANNTTGEFQLFNTRQSGVDVGTAFGAFGPAVSSLTGHLLVAGNISAAAITSTGMVLASDFSTTTTGGIDVGSAGVYTSGLLTSTGIVNNAGLTMAGTTSTIVAASISATSYRGMHAQSDIQQLTGSGNYTVPSGVFVIEVEMVGGGGSGGGAPANTTNGQSSGGGGGGGGAYLKEILFVTPGQIIAYSVGAARAGNSGAAGTAGNSTTFGSFTAGGGGAGATLATGTSNTSTAAAAGGTATGSAVVSMGGMPCTRASGTSISSGSGGNTPFGKGGEGITIVSANASFAGNAGTGFGAGGGGGVGMRTSASSAATTGGQGSAGTIIVREMK